MRRLARSPSRLLVRACEFYECPGAANRTREKHALIRSRASSQFMTRAASRSVRVRACVCVREKEREREIGMNRFSRAGAVYARTNLRLYIWRMHNTRPRGRYICSSSSSFRRFSIPIRCVICVPARVRKVSRRRKRRRHFPPSRRLVYLARAIRAHVQVLIIKGEVARWNVF